MVDKKMVRFTAVMLILLASQVVYGGGVTTMVECVAVSTEANVPPVVEISPDVSGGMAPLRVRFDGNAWDQDGEITSLEWDFEGDGLFEVVKTIPKELKGSQRMQAVKGELLREYTFVKPGIFHVLAKVTDDRGSSSVGSVTIQVYSDMPYLDVVPCNSGFEYMARAGYEAFFDTVNEKGVQFRMGNARITYRLGNQLFGEVVKTKGIPAGNVITYSNVYPGVDVRYTVYGDLLLEEFIVQNFMPFSVIEQSFTIHGMEYRMNEDGSISFYNGEDKVFSIPCPVMYELHNPANKSYGLHYEVAEQENGYILRKIIDDTNWLETAQYPVVIDSSTQGEIADPWEQQGLTPYGQYFKNLNEYVDPMTGHLTIRHTDYTLSGRGLDLTITRIYTTVVAYKQKEDGSGEYVPVATYQKAPTDLGCGWSLDFPWLDVNSKEAEKYLHLPNGTQLKTNFINNVWEDHVYGFMMYKNGDNTYTKYRDDGVREDYDDQGRIVSVTDLNGNVMTFTYGQIGYSETGPKYGLIRISDTVGRVVNFSYSAGKLMSLSDSVRTTTYNYSGDRLVSVTDPLGRVTTYEHMAGNSFLITGVHYPTGGFSTYEYTTIAPERAKLAPYKSSQTENGVPVYYVYKVDSPDTVTWTSPEDLYAVTSQGGRPCVLQRDDGSLVMYFRDTYVWTEEKCEWVGCPSDCEYVCNTITHTEYWLKRSVSEDQKHWSAPQNVVQVKTTTGNPVVIEKRDSSYVMYYMDTYVWTEQNCYWDRIKKEYVCETITHTEYWIYRRTSSDGIIWGSPVKTLQTSLGVRNIAAIQKNDSTFLLCYTDKIGSSYYIRQITSTDGLTWSTPSNVVQVDSGTGNPTLIQKDTGEIYLAYRKGNNYVYTQSNTGQGWSSPVQTTAQAQGDPSFLTTVSDLVLIYKGTNEYFYRISSINGINWSSPSQIAPQKAYSDPSTVFRKDLFYRVSAQYMSASELDLVKVTEFSYEGEDYLSSSSNIIIRDSQTIHSSMHFEFDSKGRITERITKDEQGVHTEKIVYTYNDQNNIIQQDVYAGSSQQISYNVTFGYDNWGNTAYTKDPEGAEHFYSYSNSSSANQFIDSKGLPVNLFSNAFYTNTIPSNCHTFLLGEAFINSGKVKEVYNKYNVKGNLTETKILFPTRNYSVFSGAFSEPEQTSFTFDLTGLTITNGILVISSVPVPTSETLYETHSEPGIGWHNTGTWNQKSFYADYTKCVTVPDLDCYDGQTEIGPFEHYPGSPNYTGYTTWIEENTQHVKTSYSAIVNEYPKKVEYNLNSSSWAEITSNLGTDITSITISPDQFVQGVNTMQFRDSNTYSTKFSWTLYINQGSTPQEYSTQFTYDSYGNLTSITDAGGHTTTLAYDTHHFYLASITNAFNNTVTTTYDFNTGLLTSITDAKGNTTSFEYDILGRVTKKINPDLTEKEAVYTDQNNSITIYNELDHSTICYYDGLGRLKKTEWYLSPTTLLTETYTYNYLNKVKTKVDPGGHSYTYEYDTQGRLMTLFNPDSTFMEAHYDDTTNTVSLIDENQHKKEYHYDWVGRLLWVKEYIDPVDYYLTQYTYDSAGNLTSFTDGNRNTTFYSYESLFGVTEVTYPDASEEIFSYDAVGNLLQKTTANGTITFTYDAVNRLTGIQYPDQSQVTLAYDANGNRTLMTDPEGTTTCVYDNRNQLLSETRTFNGEPYTVSYQYDAASRIASLTYPDQSVVTYGYDALSRVTAIPGYAEFTYTADSLLETMMYSNGTATTYTYNTCHRPTTIHARRNDTDLLVMNYEYDFTGNITHLEYGKRLPDQNWVQSSQTFGYDRLNRLVSAQEGTDLLSYTYDAVGNRLSQNDLTYTYNNMNELLSVNDGTVFTYDGMGNTSTKSKGTDTFSYTHEWNKLTQVEKNQHTITEYTYDGDGRRIQKTEWSDTLQEYQPVVYVYSGGNVIYEKNTHTGKKATYVYGPTGRIAKNVDGLIQYYHRDHLGSTRLLTDESGNVRSNAEYEPFGKSTKSGEAEENHLYTGKEIDASRLYYYGARYYDPEMGRWIERDPKGGVLENPMSLNRYVYCYNNPLFYIDPDGCDPKVNDLTAKLVTAYWLIGTAVAAPTIVGGIAWGIAGGIYRYWLERNWNADVSLDAEGNPVIIIYAKGDTPGIEAYFASIVIEAGDKGSYKGYIRNASTTLVAVAVSHNGSGALDLYLGGSGPQLLTIVGSGNVNIHIGTDCTGLVTLNIRGTGIVTIYVPMGQSPPQVTGGGDYIIVYCNPEDEEDEEDEDES